jgi:hypothetical protein
MSPCTWGGRTVRVHHHQVLSREMFCTSWIWGLSITPRPEFNIICLTCPTNEELPFLSSTGVELRVSLLLTWATPSALFSLAIFEIRSHIYA